jgi:hypothetical protein
MDRRRARREGSLRAKVGLVGGLRLPVVHRRNERRLRDGRVAVVRSWRPFADARRDRPRSRVDRARPEDLRRTRVGARIVGGNLSGGEIVTLTTSVLGLAARPIRRQGAKVGDGLFLCGEVGMAAAGLRALRLGKHGADVEPCVLAWKRPPPRVAAGLAMAGVAHAAIDVSDGLVGDVRHLAEASGVCAVIDLALLLAHGGDPLARAAEAVGADVVDLALQRRRGLRPRRGEPRRHRRVFADR